MKVVTAPGMQLIDQLATKKYGIPALILMENAAICSSFSVLNLLKPGQKDVLLFCGQGNNGGDGLVAARYLQERGATVSVYLFSERPADDENLKLVREKNITCIEASNDKSLEKFDGLLASATCVPCGLSTRSHIQRPISPHFRRTSWSRVSRRARVSTAAARSAERRG